MTTKIYGSGSKDRRNFNVPLELLTVADAWWSLSQSEGDKGCCVLGAHMKFEYVGEDYYMYPQSPYQGENSWTPFVDRVKTSLEELGATKIKWDRGVMD